MGDRVDLPETLVALLRQASPCFLTTLMPDGSPQVTQTWVDTDGTNLLVNTVQTHQKTRNVGRDARVALAVCRAEDPSRCYEVRGRVVGVTTDGAVEHIESLAQRYLGGPYPWYGGRDQVRVVLTIEPDVVHAMDR